MVLSFLSREAQKRNQQQNFTATFSTKTPDAGVKSQTDSPGNLILHKSVDYANNWLSWKRTFLMNSHSRKYMYHENLMNPTCTS